MQTSWIKKGLTAWLCLQISLVFWLSLIPGTVLADLESGVTEFSGKLTNDHNFVRPTLPSDIVYEENDGVDIIYSPYFNYTWFYSESGGGSWTHGGNTVPYKTGNENYTRNYFVISIYPLESGPHTLTVIDSDLVAEYQDTTLFIYRYGFDRDNP
jgi:hypothetical protein